MSEELLIDLGGVSFHIVSDNWSMDQLRRLLAAHCTDIPVSGQPLHRIDLIPVKKPVNISRPESADWIGQLYDGTPVSLYRQGAEMTRILLGEEVEAMTYHNEGHTVCHLFETSTGNAKKRPQPGGYFLAIMQRILSCYGCYVVHGAAVAREGLGIVLLGDSGVGKTTTSLALADLGFDYLADDLVGVAMRNDSPMLYPLCLKAKVVDRKSEAKRLVDMKARQAEIYRATQLNSIVSMQRSEASDHRIRSETAATVCGLLLAHGNDSSFIYDPHDWMSSAAALAQSTRGYTWVLGPVSEIRHDLVQVFFSEISSFSPCSAEVR